MSDVSDISSDEDDGTDVILREIDEARRNVAREPESYAARLELVKVLSRRATEAKTSLDCSMLKTERYEFHKRFPLSQKMWLEWLDEAKRTPNSYDDDEVLSLHRSSTQDYLSPRLWKEYLVFLRQKTTCSPDDVRSVFEEAVEKAGEHALTSHLIWEEYESFEKETSGSTIISLRRLKKPLMANTEEYVRQLDLNDDDRSKAIELLKDVKKNLNETKTMEANLAKAGKHHAKFPFPGPTPGGGELGGDVGMEKAWVSYLERRKRQRAKGKTKRGNVRRLLPLRERSVADCCLSERLWLDYVFEIDHLVKDRELSVRVHARALRNLPWSTKLWTSSIFSNFRLEKKRMGGSDSSDVVRDPGAILEKILQIHQEAVKATEVSRDVLACATLDVCARLGLGDVATSRCLATLSDNPEARARFISHVARRMCFRKTPSTDWIAEARVLTSESLRTLPSDSSCWRSHLDVLLRLCIVDASDENVSNTRTAYRQAIHKTRQFTREYMEFERFYGSQAAYDVARAKVREDFSLFPGEKGGSIAVSELGASSSSPPRSERGGEAKSLKKRARDFGHDGPRTLKKERRDESSKEHVAIWINLDYGSSEQDVRTHVQEHAPDTDVQWVRFKKNKRTGRNSGVGFVACASSDELETLVAKCNGTILRGRTLRVEKAVQKLPSELAEKEAAKRAIECTLYVGKLSPDEDVTRRKTSEIRRFLALRHLPVSKSIQMLDSTGCSKKSGWIQFTTPDVAQTALELLKAEKFFVPLRKISVNRSKRPVDQTLVGKEENDDDDEVAMRDDSSPPPPPPPPPPPFDEKKQMVPTSVLSNADFRKFLLE